MPVLTISDGDVLRTARLDTADTTDLADAAFVVDSEQDAIESGLRAEALADASLVPLLTRNVMKLLAAEVLEMRSREDGATGTFAGAGVTLGQQTDHAARLRNEARLALAPFVRTGIGGPVLVSPHVALSDLDAQAKLFGPTEADRARTGDDA